MEKIQGEAGGAGGLEGGSGFLPRLLGVFTAPDRAFAALDRRPGTWWQPLVLVVVAGLVAVHLIYNPVIVPAQREVLERKGLEGEQLEQAASLIGSAWVQALAYGGAVLEPLVAALIAALLGHFGAAFLLGGAGNFARSWSVVCYVLPIGVLESLIKVPIMLAQGRPDVHFGPALLFPVAEVGEPRDFLFHLAAQADVFTLWKLAVGGLGLALVHRVRRGSMLGLVFAMWALWAVGAAAVAKAVGG
jgi:hypothetical protein